MTDAAQARSTIWAHRLRPPRTWRSVRPVLILAIILFGMIVGAIAQVILGKKGLVGVDWGMALVAGILGSFVGGLLFSLIAGDGIKLRASGIIGSLIGAILVTLLWQWVASRRPATRRR